MESPNVLWKENVSMSPGVPISPVNTSGELATVKYADAAENRLFP
jgi:hypothetical protein